jgi:hypothetical protein
MNFKQNNASMLILPTTSIIDDFICNSRHVLSSDNRSSLIDDVVGRICDYIATNPTNIRHLNESEFNSQNNNELNHWTEVLVDEVTMINDICKTYIRHHDPTLFNLFKQEVKKLLFKLKDIYYHHNLIEEKPFKDREGGYYYSRFMFETVINNNEVLLKDITVNTSHQYYYD